MNIQTELLSTFYANPFDTSISKRSYPSRALSLDPRPTISKV